MSIYKDIDYRLNTENRDIRISPDAEAINNSLRNIILTRKGEVPGNPDFGSNIEEVLFEQLDDITEILLKSMITIEIEKWETRVELKDVVFTSDRDNGVLMMNIKYEMLASNEILSTVIKINLG